MIFYSLLFNKPYSLSNNLVVFYFNFFFTMENFYEKINGESSGRRSYSPNQEYLDRIDDILKMTSPSLNDNSVIESLNIGTPKSQSFANESQPPSTFHSFQQRLTDFQSASVHSPSSNLSSNISNISLEGAVSNTDDESQTLKESDLDHSSTPRLENINESHRNEFIRAQHQGYQMGISPDSIAPSESCSNIGHGENTTPFEGFHNTDCDETVAGTLQLLPSVDQLHRTMKLIMKKINDGSCKSIASLTDYKYTPEGSKLKDPTKMAFENLSATEINEYKLYESNKDGFIQKYSNIDWECEKVEAFNQSTLNKLNRRAKILKKIFNLHDCYPENVVWMQKNHPELIPLLNALDAIDHIEKNRNDVADKQTVRQLCSLMCITTENEIRRIKKIKEEFDVMRIKLSNRWDKKIERSSHPL